MKAVFLDRDGVINKYPGDKKYVTLWKDFHFLPRAKLAIAKLSKKKFKLFVVSNQAGINKGLFTQSALDK
ncbi:MAG: D,D-heptose 1,7-bisphosphate phosphatase, partial [Candidatus Omnitrophica bacterium]|nr:D,D-heptose 1,7-bisphosphate phosphatase [Candidatus Omnitrophota bacterium]